MNHKPQIVEIREIAECEGFMVSLVLFCPAVDDVVGRLLPAFLVWGYRPIQQPFWLN